MSGETCSYDCGVTSQVIPSYTDISGIGVVAGYVVTAFFAVVITSSYYLLAYQPDLDPFCGAKNQDTISRYRANPIDKIFLSWLPRCLMRKPVENGRYSRLEKALIKLRCGLSAYHWQVLVYLAWFSSLTHLCCLTFLRNYLFNHPGQRVWRLISMFIIIVMLVVALIPTGNFDWLSYSKRPEPPTPPPGSYAICFFGQKPSRVFDSGMSVAPNSYLSMIISSFSLVLGFSTRVFRSHKTLSINFTQRLRFYLSIRARIFLRSVYSWCQVQVHPQSLRRSLIYHPLLAGFLMLRVSLDCYSSMLVEVWWLLVGFTWGMIHLVLTLNLAPVGVSSPNWSFGQVIQVVLLAAPIITIVEFFYEDDDAARLYNAQLNPAAVVVRVETLPITDNAQSDPSILGHVEALAITENPYNSHMENLQDDPDFDFYKSSWFTWVVVYTLISICVVSICIVVYTALGTPMALFVLYPIPWLWWKWSLFSIPLTFWCFIIFIILLEDLRLQAPKSRSRDLSYLGFNVVLGVVFQAQLVVYKVILPVVQETAPSTGVWVTWIIMVLPVEFYFFVAGHRAGTVSAFLLTLFLGAGFLVGMIWALLFALNYSS